MKPSEIFRVDKKLFQKQINFIFLFSKGVMSAISTSLSNEEDILPSKDVLFRCCKKIAQLTKVIAFLNTKYEDSQYKINQQSKLYTLELNNLAKDITDRLHKSFEEEKESLEKTYQSNLGLKETAIQNEIDKSNQFDQH